MASAPDEESLWTVRRLGRRRINPDTGRVEYRTYWEGYDAPTWEPAYCLLDHCESLMHKSDKIHLQELHATQPKLLPVTPAVCRKLLELADARRAAERRSGAGKRLTHRAARARREAPADDDDFDEHEQSNGDDNGVNDDTAGADDASSDGGVESSDEGGAQREQQGGEPAAASEVLFRQSTQTLFWEVLRHGPLPPAATTAASLGDAVQEDALVSTDGDLAARAAADAQLRETHARASLAVLQASAPERRLDSGNTEEAMLGQYDRIGARLRSAIAAPTDDELIAQATHRDARRRLPVYGVHDPQVRWGAGKRRRADKTSGRRRGMGKALDSALFELVATAGVASRVVPCVHPHDSHEATQGCDGGANAVRVVELYRDDGVVPPEAAEQAAAPGDAVPLCDTIFRDAVAPTKSDDDDDEAVAARARAAYDDDADFDGLVDVAQINVEPDVQAVEARKWLVAFEEGIEGSATLVRPLVEFRQEHPQALIDFLVRHMRVLPLKTRLATYHDDAV